MPVNTALTGLVHLQSFTGMVNANWEGTGSIPLNYETFWRYAHSFFGLVGYIFNVLQHSYLLYRPSF